MQYYLASVLNEIWYKYARFVASYALFIAAKILFLIGHGAKARSFCAASLRYGINSSCLMMYKKIIEYSPYGKDDSSLGVKVGEASTRTIIVRWPTFEGDRINKGILVITFTRTFSYYLRNIRLDKLGKYFHVVLEPSWSGYADPDIIGFVGRLDSVIVQASEVEDKVLLSSFPDTFIPVSFGASDWVDSRLFDDRCLPKLYDSVYIANTNPIKRVRRYLEAIKGIVNSGKRDYVGCLVCASWGGAQELIAKMVDGYGLKENIVLKFSLGRDEIIECLNQSKVNILLSYKEGSNRSLFEAIFCNIPVICIRENVGVNKSYINEFTGLLIADLQLEDSLVWMKDNYQLFRPRDWAMQNIDPRITTLKLTTLINGRNSTGSFNNQQSQVYVKTNNPEVSYYDYPKLSHSTYSDRLLRLFELNGGNSEISDEMLVEGLTQAQNEFVNDLKKADSKIEKLSEQQIM